MTLSLSLLSLSPTYSLTHSLPHCCCCHKQPSQTHVCVCVGNHPLDPDAFHPMFFSDSRVLPAADRDAGLLLSTPPDPAWLNEGDCGDKAWNTT